MANNKLPEVAVKGPDRLQPRNGPGTIGGVINQLTRTQRPDLVAAARNDQVGVRSLIAELQAAKGGDQPSHVIAMLNLAIDLATQAHEELKLAEQQIAEAVALGAAAAGHLIHGKDYVPQTDKLPSPFPPTVNPPSTMQQIPRAASSAPLPPPSTPPPPPNPHVPRPPVDVPRR